MAPHASQSLERSFLTFFTQDCAGAILYSTEKSIEVALEAQQCLGGNGYTNGELMTSVPFQINALIVVVLMDPIRISSRTHLARHSTLCCWSWHAGDSANVDRERIQQPVRKVEMIVVPSISRYGLNVLPIDDP